jgi:hypothetical protein
MTARRSPPPRTVDELAACFVVTDSAGQKVPEPLFGDPMVYYVGSRRTKNPRCSLKSTDAKRPYSARENAMMRALVLGAAALTLSAGAASAQAVYPSYGYAPYGYGYSGYGYAATAPLYDYAAPGYGYAGYGAPATAGTTVIIVTPGAPPYTAPPAVVSGYAPGYWGGYGRW